MKSSLSHVPIYSGGVTPIPEDGEVEIIEAHDQIPSPDDYAKTRKPFVCLPPFRKDEEGHVCLKYSASLGQMAREKVASGEAVLEFGAISSHGEICSFARKYGLLRSNKNQTVYVLTPFEERDSTGKIISSGFGFGGKNRIGEPLDLWLMSIKEIKHALLLLDEIQKRWSRDSFETLSAMINEKKPALYVETGIDPVTGKPAVLYVPQNLLSAMWHSIASALTGNLIWRRCQDCGKWVTWEGKKGKGDNWTTCETCRTKRTSQRTRNGKRWEELTPEERASLLRDAPWNQLTPEEKDTVGLKIKRSKGRPRKVK